MIVPKTPKVETSMRERRIETGTRITSSEMETDTETKTGTEMRIGIETKTGTVIRTGTEIKTDTEIRRGTEKEVSGIDLFMALSLSDMELVLPQLS